MHIIISSGGTGGHFYPGLSIAREFVARGNQVTFLISGQQAAEQQSTTEANGIAARQIPSVRAPRTIPELLLFPFRFWKCCRAIKKTLRDLKGDALLSMGSFTSVAPCWCWPKSPKPLFLHEGNTFMGQANRLFAKKATALALTLPLAIPAQTKGTPSCITGMPLREAILDAAKNPPSPAQRAEILHSFGLTPDKKTALIFGGSQGARAIVNLVTDSIPLLADCAKEIQFIILTGADDNTALEHACQAAGIAARIAKKDPEIQRCYQVADIVVCRAGASSICELALFQKTAALIPLPSAKDNHQFHNAKCLADANAAALLTQSQTTPDSFADFLKDWLSHPEKFADMPAAIGQFARPDATRQVVDFLSNFLPKPQP